MKIIEDYKALKREHSLFFKKYQAKDRLKFSKEIISIKKRIEEIELKLVNGILNFTFNYNRVYNYLKNDQLHGFLKENEAISRFLTKQKISQSIGYNEDQRNQVLIDFKKLCEKVWEDYIITHDERKELNDFCKSNFIDRTQQFLIEQEISKKYTDGFDLNKVVEFYYLNENLSDSQIEMILNREYRKKVSLSKIQFITTQLENKISKDLEIGNSKSKLIKTLVFNDILTIYLIVINGNITSGFEFEIGYNQGEKDALKIMISKKTFEDSDETRLIDILTDGLSYNLCSSSMNLRQFLEQKSIIRETIQSSF